MDNSFCLPDLSSGGGGRFHDSDDPEQFFLSAGSPLLAKPGFLRESSFWLGSRWDNFKSVNHSDNDINPDC